jgi:uncharacterized membrane protein YphA (DoxX/SURF4 family)
MTLLRTAARTLLASYFVASGVKAVRNPAALVPAAEPLTDKVVPLVKEYAPAQVAHYVPEDAKTLVRINGAAQILGGVALATGKGRRLGALLLAGSLIPSTIAKYPFWAQQDPEQRAEARQHFLKNASLLGGVLLASVDTEGKPSLAWRAQKGTQALARDTRRTGTQLSRSSSELSSAALASGAALVGTVVKQSRKARRKAAKQAEQARVAAKKAAKKARKQTKGTAKDLQKQLAAAQQRAGRTARDLARSDAAKKVAELPKVAAKQARAIQKSAGEVAANIRLGEN